MVCVYMPVNGPALPFPTYSSEQGLSLNLHLSWRPSVSAPTTLGLQIHAQFHAPTTLGLQAHAWLHTPFHTRAGMWTQTAILTHSYPLSRIFSSQMDIFENRVQMELSNEYVESEGISSLHTFP